MRNFLLIICIVVFLFSMFQITQYILDARKTNDLYKDIAEIYHVDIENQENANSDGNNGDNDIDTLDELRKINPDIIGWITVPETKIDYPVVKASDNDYYLNHDINGEENKHGAIFMDYINDPDKDENIVIYGHHMRDGTMFKDLVKFKKEDFYNHNKSISLNIEGKTSEYEIFSIYIANASSLDIKISFKDTAEYEEYFSSVKEKSIYPSSLTFDKDKTMLTLFTCTYEEKDARLVLHALPIE